MSPNLKGSVRSLSTPCWPMSTVAASKIWVRCAPLSTSSPAFRITSNLSPSLAKLRYFLPFPSSPDWPLSSSRPICAGTILVLRKANFSVEMSRILTRLSNASLAFWTRRTRRRNCPKAAEVSWRAIRPVPQRRSNLLKVPPKRVMALLTQSLLQRIATMRTTKIRSHLLPTNSPLSLSRRESFKNQNPPRNQSPVRVMRSPAGREVRTLPGTQMLSSRTGQILCSSKSSTTDRPVEAPAAPQALPLVRLSPCPVVPLSPPLPVAIIAVCVGIIFTLLAALLYTQRRGAYSDDDMPTVKGYWRAPSIQASLYDDSTHSEGAVVYGEGGLEMEVSPSNKITSSNFRPDCPAEVRI
jgi:hypothetical protein